MARNSSPIRAPSFSLMSFMVSEREESDGGQIVFRWRLVWPPRVLVYFFSSYLLKTYWETFHEGLQKDCVLLKFNCVL
jgi:hypothetical protein